MDSQTSTVIQRKRILQPLHFREPKEHCTVQEVAEQVEVVRRTVFLENRIEHLGS